MALRREIWHKGQATILKKDDPRMTAHSKGIKGRPQLSQALSIDNPWGGELRGTTDRSLVESSRRRSRHSP